MRTIDVTVFDRKPRKLPRPAPSIVAKDTTPYVSFLRELPSGDVLVVETPRTIKELGRLVKRRGDDFAILKTLEGVNGRAALSPDGKRLLVGGPWVEYDIGSAVLFDLERWKIERRLPVVPPFLWIDETRFVAHTPHWKSDMLKPAGQRRAARRVDKKVARDAPSFMTDEDGLVLADLERDSAKLILSVGELQDERALALSDDGKILYSADSRSRVSAVRLADQKLLWQRPPNRLVQEGHTKAIAFDCVRNQVIAAGGGATDFLALDAKTGAVNQAGRELAGLVDAGFPKSHRFECFAVRSDGFMALATEQGTVLELPPDGPWQVFQATAKSIEAMTFTKDGSELLVGGADKHLRTVSMAYRSFSPAGTATGIPSAPSKAPKKGAPPAKKTAAKKKSQEGRKIGRK